MAEAEVGNDVFGDDPTVKRLEETTAVLLGKEASLFVPSGRMGNAIVVAVNTKPGQEILLDRYSHMVGMEAAALTEFLGRRFRLLDGDRGRLAPGPVASGIAAARREGADLGLVETENTHNWGSGSVYALDQLRGVGEAARGTGLWVHLDGARIWNACAATGLTPADYAGCADTVMVTYSKGLGAPIGSAIAGTRAFIGEARDVRKMFGGEMPQVGIIAAAALYALEHHREGLRDDHRRARRLAEAFADTPGLSIRPEEVETNILITELTRCPERLGEFLGNLGQAGVLAVAFGGPGRFRAVTHRDLDDAGIERAAMAVRRTAATMWDA
jgi:threonine aldolase